MAGAASYADTSGGRNGWQTGLCLSGATVGGEGRRSVEGVVLTGKNGVNYRGRGIPALSSDVAPCESVVLST